jgi:threonine dehydrogenase-like Zn-dependent dehydrogenase
VPATCLHEISTDVPVDVAVLAEPLAACVHAFRLAPPGLRSVVILGGGPIGLLVAQVARHLGAHRIVVSEPIQERRNWASSVADAALWPTELTEGVGELTDGRGADLVVDAVGLDSTRAASVGLLARGGVAIWVGMHDMEARIPALDLVASEQRIQGSFAYTNADFARAVQLLEHDPTEFVLPVRAFALDQGGHVFERLLDGQSNGFLKAVLSPNAGRLGNQDLVVVANDPEAHEHDTATGRGTG